MASIGKKKPERKMLGNMVTMTVMKASCCVLAIVEANKPMPRLEMRNKPERAKMSPRSPLIGTLNHQVTNDQDFDHVDERQDGIWQDFADNQFP